MPVFRHWRDLTKKDSFFRAKVSPHDGKVAFITSLQNLFSVFFFAFLTHLHGSSHDVRFDVAIRLPVSGQLIVDKRAE